MERKSYINAVRLYVVLHCLANKEWHNINYLSREVKTSNPTRLKKQLDVWIKREMIQDWESLPDEDKKKAKKEQRNIIRNNNYRITDKGLDKLNKIRDSCREPKLILSSYEEK